MNLGPTGYSRYMDAAKQMVSGALSSGFGAQAQNTTNPNVNQKTDYANLMNGRSGGNSHAAAQKTEALGANASSSLAAQQKVNAVHADVSGTLKEARRMLGEVADGNIAPPEPSDMVTVATQVVMESMAPAVEYVKTALDYAQDRGRNSTEIQNRIETARQKLVHQETTEFEKAFDQGQNTPTQTKLNFTNVDAEHLVNAGDKQPELEQLDQQRKFLEDQEQEQLLADKQEQQRSLTETAAAVFAAANLDMRGNFKGAVGSLGEDVKDVLASLDEEPDMRKMLDNETTVAMCIGGNGTA